MKKALNCGLLPPECYAFAEGFASGLEPDVLTLQRLTPKRLSEPELEERAFYLTRAKAVVIRHRSNHKVIAMIELVSPGNKSSRNPLLAFVRKAQEALLGGIHLLIVDLFPPGPRDRQGLHPLIWGKAAEDPFTLPPDKPLTCAAYVGGIVPGFFVEPVAVGDPLPEMPLFLTPDEYIPMPLEATYQSAWESVPQYWRDVLTATAT
jgi:hypothetical protein